MNESYSSNINPCKLLYTMKNEVWASQQIHYIQSSLFPVSILQVISQLQSVGSTSSAAFWQATRTWRSRQCCPSPTLAWPEWTQLGISLKAWRSQWLRPNTYLELWLSSTSSCPWRKGTPSVLTSSLASWRSPLNPWPSLVGCCCTKTSDLMGNMGETFSTRASNLSAWTLRDRATGHWTVSETEINRNISERKTGFFQQGERFIIFYLSAKKEGRRFSLSATVTVFVLCFTAFRKTTCAKSNCVFLFFDMFPTEKKPLQGYLIIPYYML